MFEVGKRAHVSRGGRVIAGLALALLGGFAVFSSRELGAAAWGFFGVALIGLLALVFWRADERRVMHEEELIEVAQMAIKSEAQRLDQKRAELDKILMAYGEWMEFPDFKELKNTEWATTERSRQDELVTALVASESDRMLKAFSKGMYWKDRQFQTRDLMVDLFNYVEQVARIYRPESEKPLLETNLEAMLKAVNRASLQVILLLEEFPILDVKELSLRKMSDSIRKASKVYHKYEELQPFLEPVRYLWQGSKFLMYANPLLALGWIAGSELIWKGGKHIGRKALDAYLLSLMRQSLGIIAWETAAIFDRTHRYRNPDWVYAVEVADLVSRFPLTRDTLRGALKELGNIPLRSSYDRIFLYRCVAQHISPKPERFSQPDLLSPECRRQIVERLEAFFKKHEKSAGEKQIANWRKDVEKRLGLAPKLLAE